VTGLVRNAVFITGHLPPALIISTPSQFRTSPRQLDVANDDQISEYAE
jgi:hypothetical protein